jgi:hypothetical protein
MGVERCALLGNYSIAASFVAAAGHDGAFIIEGSHVVNHNCC